MKLFTMVTEQQKKAVIYVVYFGVVFTFCSYRNVFGQQNIVSHCACCWIDE